MSRVAGHLAEHVDQPRPKREDREHLDQVAKGRGILERVRRVGVEEAATVGAKHLDRFLRGDRPLRDGLREALDAC